MKILSEVNDKTTFYKIIDILIENKNKKTLIAFNGAWGEIGGLFQFSDYIPMESNSSINSIITQAIQEKYEVLIFYTEVLTPEDIKTIEEMEQGIEIILSNAK